MLYDSGRIASYNYVIRKALCDDAACANRHIISEANTREDNRIHADPTIVTYADILWREMVRWVRWIMVDGYYSHIRADKTAFADMDIWGVLDIYSRPPYMRTVLAVDF